MRRTAKLLTLLAAFVMVFGLVQTSFAALSALGPNNPTNNFPVWYQDTAGVAVEQCNFSAASPDPNCIPAGAAGVPIPGIDFEEAFWWAGAADAAGQGVNGLLDMAIEAAFATGEPVAGQQITFGRIRIRVDVTAAGQYTVTHPYGVNVYNVDTPGIRAINDTVDIGGGPGDFVSILGTDIGPLLKCVTPAPPAGYLGNFATTCTVTGSPNATNIFRIQGPGGIDVSTSLFNISGKIFTGVVPTPLTVDRATYDCSAIGACSVTVNVASAPTASVTVSGAGLGAAPTGLTSDGAGNFFARIPVTAGSAVPAAVTITSAAAGLTTSVITVPVIDVVTVTRADFNILTGALAIRATTSDQRTPGPALTLPGVTPTPLTVVGGVGTVVLRGLLIAPSSVTVASSAGGSGSSIVGFAAAAASPTAVNDIATTAARTAVLVSVLANDAAAAGATLVPASVTVATQPLNGTASVSVTGAILYTPDAAFAGTDTFTYRVSDDAGLASNVATVTITVRPPTETFAFKVTDFVASKAEWNIQGVSTAVGAAVTIHLGPTLNGPVIGTATVLRGGTWIFRGTSATVPTPGAVRTISVESTGGAVRLGRALRVN